MARIAYLGPACSFSHELLKRDFENDEHMPCGSLQKVVSAVAEDKCKAAVVPFYNTTRLSIEESHVELIRHRSRVFVSDVLVLDVKHTLCGFGKVDEIRELRSKSVVYHQAKKWLDENLPGIREKHYTSTSAAVRSVAKSRKREIAAIGTLSATNEYVVPVIKRNIQNKPNSTLFFVVKNVKPNLQTVDHLLMCLPGAQEPDKDAIEEIIRECDCSLSSNWPVRVGAKESYFFELNGRHSKLGLRSAEARIRDKNSNVFIVGGYKEKCITELAWQQSKSKTPQGGI